MSENQTVAKLNNGELIKQVKFKWHINFLWMILIVAFGVGGYFLFSLNQKYNELNFQLNIIKTNKLSHDAKELGQFQSIQDTSNELQQKIDTLNFKYAKSINQLNTKVDNIASKSRVSSNLVEFKLIEIKSCLEIASWILAYQYNLDACLNLLKTIDRKALNIGQQESKIRQALAQDPL